MTQQQNLVAMTVRLEPVIMEALRIKAERSGQEPADYAAGVLTNDVLPVIQETNQVAARRLQAEMELKAKAIDLAQKLVRPGFDPHVTLKVFQAIRTDDSLRSLYLRAIGNRPGDERGNPIKARINRTLGAAIKTAVKADPETTINGDPLKVQVSNEFIFSYTQLRPAA